MDTEEKVKNFFKSLGWVIALILIGVIIGIFLSPKGSALDWPFGKASYCQFGNFTTPQDCDVSWCNNVLTNESQTCNFDLNDTLCKCTLKIENFTNETTNQTQSIILSSDYYNKSEIDNQTAELKKYMENLTLTLRNSMLDRLDNVSAPIYYGDDEGSAPSNTPWYTWVLVSIIVIGGLYAISTSKKNTNIPIEASRKRQIIERPVNFNNRPQNIAKRNQTIQNKKEENDEDEVM